MPAHNDVTGDPIVTKKTGDSYRDGWERIFGNKHKQKQEIKEKKDDSKVRDKKKVDG